jgi:hypothetical protein
VPRHGIHAVLCASILLLSACGGATVNELSVGPTPIRCELSLESSSANVAASASQLTVGVVTTADCAWTAQSSAAWLQVTPTTGQGAATVSLSVTANSQQSTRTSAVAVNGVQFTVTQAAAAAPPPPPCTYVLNPTSRSINENGGERSFTISTTSACAWTATSTVSWITIESAASGSGNGRIDYRVARNNNRNGRTGAIIVGGQSHVVNQEGD